MRADLPQHGVAHVIGCVLEPRLLDDLRGDRLADAQGIVWYKECAADFIERAPHRVSHLSAEHERVFQEWIDNGQSCCLRRRRERNLLSITAGVRNPSSWW